MLDVQIACLIALSAVLVIAATQDLRTGEIANGISLAVVGLFAIFSIAELASDRTASSFGVALASAGIVFLAGTGAFTLGMLGGGDVKLLAAVSLFAGSTRLMELLAVAALAGGMLAVVALAGVPLGRASGAAAGGLRARLQSALPLGPAIAAGGIWVALSLGFP